MKEIRLNGREASVVRYIGFGAGVTGNELLERTNMALEDLCDALNAMLETGYVETASMKQKVTVEEVPAEIFEVNPSYVGDLKVALRR